MKLKYVLSLFVILLIAACSGGENAPAVEPTATAVPAAATPAPTQTETAVPPTPPPTAAPAAETIELDIEGFLFRPERLEVPVGATVIWTNQDDIQHSVTNGTPDNPGDAFDSGFFVQGEQFTYTFTEPGEYPYFCRRHHHMQATIVVIPANE